MGQAQTVLSPTIPLAIGHDYQTIQYSYLAAGLCWDTGLSYNTTVSKAENLGKHSRMLEAA